MICTCVFLKQKQPLDAQLNAHKETRFIKNNISSVDYWQQSCLLIPMLPGHYLRLSDTIGSGLTAQSE